MGMSRTAGSHGMIAQAGANTVQVVVVRTVVQVREPCGGCHGNGGTGAVKLR